MVENIIFCVILRADPLLNFHTSRYMYDSLIHFKCHEIDIISRTLEESFASVHFTSHSSDTKETNIFSSSYVFFSVLFVQQALRVCFIAIFIALIAVHIIQRHQILFFHIHIDFTVILPIIVPHYADTQHELCLYQYLFIQQ